MILVLKPFFLIIFFNSFISFSLLTKDRAIQSTSFLRPNIKSLISLSVTEESFISLSGRLTPFLSRSFPPLITSTLILLFRVSTTFNSIFPSSIRILSPDLISSIISLSIEISSFVPTLFPEEIKNSSPSFNRIESLLSLPTLIFGPCKSCRTVIGVPNSSLIFLTLDIVFL